MTSTEIVIIGAGVIGLSIAHVLATNTSRAFNIKIVARDMPDDLNSPAFASPWAVRIFLIYINAFCRPMESSFLIPRVQIGPQLVNLTRRLVNARRSRCKWWHNAHALRSLNCLRASK